VLVDDPTRRTVAGGAHFRNAESALTEAAMLDGANNWQTFRRIHLPLATPAWSALAILFFLANGRVQIPA
jgi:ABC-type glycerol-3-phosphate transport system permease component